MSDNEDSSLEMAMLVPVKVEDRFLKIKKKKEPTLNLEIIVP